VLADIIGSGAVPVVRLTEVFRQAAASRIIVNAHRLNQGLMPDLSSPTGDSDFYFVPAEDPEIAVQRILELVKTRIPKRFGLNPVRDIQVLCPMNRGGVGARLLNIELQAALNPAGERKVERFGWTFAPGDKVMQIENDYDKEVYNGDIGYVGDVDPEAGELTASFDGRAVTYGFGELDTLVPAYAATIHKSQGSEYPAVIIPVLTQHYTMLQRNLLYTGITPGQAARRPGRPEEGHCDRSSQRLGPTTLVEARRVASPRRVPRSIHRVQGGLRMVAPGFLKNPEVTHWLGGVEPAWTLLTFESMNALRQEPSNENRALTLANDLTGVEIAQSAVARNTLILLRRASEGEGLKLTATGNLSRAVVVEMIDHFEWPDFERSEAFRLNKVVNEPDFMPLFFVRHVASLARLVRPLSRRSEANALDVIC